MARDHSPHQAHHSPGVHPATMQLPTSIGLVSCSNAHTCASAPAHNASAVCVPLVHRSCGRSSRQKVLEGFKLLASGNGFLLPINKNALAIEHPSISDEACEHCRPRPFSPRVRLQRSPVLSRLQFRHIMHASDVCQQLHLLLLLHSRLWFLRVWSL